MNAEIVAIGTELLLGATVDTNSAWLANELAPVGVSIGRVTLVGDDRREISAVVSAALERAELVICSGGLGPTADDLTREGIADAVGRELELRPELLEQIEARFRAFGREMSESNRRQAYIPRGARGIPNPRGTAPAFLAEHRGHVVIALPGVPAELRYLVHHALIPYLQTERELSAYMLLRSLHLSGTTESTAGDLIADLMTLSNPRVGITAKGGQYEVRMAAEAGSREEAEQILAPIEAQLRQRLAPYLTEGGKLAEHVVQMLDEHKTTLALYEGHCESPVFHAFGAALGRAPVLRGLVVHPLNEPVDAEGAESLARDAAIATRQRWQADIGLAVQATEPGPDGFAEVCFVLVTAGGERVLHRKLDLGSGDGWTIAGNAGLDLLRRAL